MKEAYLPLGQARLRFAERAEGGYGFGLQAPSEDGWRDLVVPNNPLLRGMSFNLYPSNLEALPDSIRATGTGQGIHRDGAPVQYTFEATLKTLEGWLELDLTLDLPQDLELQMLGGYEPEITLDLGALPPYDRGDHVWFKTCIQNPTRWNDEAYGNDFPALYYFDPYRSLELMMFFDLTAMDWMGRENIARFLNYRCGFRRRYKPSPMGEVGLYADGFSGTVLRAGQPRFRYFLSFGERHDPPTEQQALVHLVEACLELLPPSSPRLEGATTWQAFAEGCAQDLLDPQCWGHNQAVGDYILNYVNGYSPAWEEALAARGIKVDFKASPCLDSAAWIGAPLSVLSKIEGQPNQVRLLERLSGFTRRYLSAHGAGLGQGVQGGTWQFYFILEQLWYLAQNTQDSEIADFCEEVIHRLAIPLAQNLEYLFPLSYNSQTLSRAGNGDNYPVGGLYAQLMLSLYAYRQDSRYLEESKRALRVLGHLPINCLSQEVFLNGAAAQAAASLYRITHEPRDLELARYMRGQALRMMYWYDDHSVQPLEYHTLGMFQACSPILYPAFFENIEVLLRLATSFDVLPPSIGLLRAFNHARINSFGMFPACLPPNRHASSLRYIPFENVGMLEDEKTGWIGQEIYGSGQVFGAYLLWEALARADHTEVMVICLDPLRANGQPPSNTLEFVVFNASSAAISTTVEFVQSANTFQVGNSRDSLQAANTADGQIALYLEPAEICWIQIELSQPNSVV